ncbi:formylglycine-generating enzyme family protein [Demequina aurantiaca]|uniref:formylglycine-generating enzyme family protein n=1 Tax=Demequina aurantiaca TaxID=676200 RepID=UPI0007813596|nr:formylglycine-generating enzyme family protein [Demequina aurantiaca]
MSEHHPDGACCAPASDRTQPRLSLPIVTTGTAAHSATASHSIGQKDVPGGTFVMGDSYGDGREADGECVVHEVTLDAFTIDETSVTNDDFAKFIAATGHRTEAEVFGDSAVFHLAVQAERKDIIGQPPAVPWWLGVAGADWAHPNGPLSSLDGIGDHPVTHVSWNDAMAYCAWAGRRLPTEAEWERASRGSLVGARYPWGDELMANDGAWQCNIWQGQFPRVNTQEDGWLTTAPVRTYAPNDLGLWQTVGNVWEWCSDWYDEGYYNASPAINPTGPDSGESRVLRGGSYLCHDSYCNRYRNAARSQNTPDSSMGNAGFRTVAL